MRRVQEAQRVEALIATLDACRDFVTDELDRRRTGIFPKSHSYVKEPAILIRRLDKTVGRWHERLRTIKPEQKTETA